MNLFPAIGSPGLSLRGLAPFSSCPMLLSQRDISPDGGKVKHILTTQRYLEVLQLLAGVFIRQPDMLEHELIIKGLPDEERFPYSSPAIDNDKLRMI